MPIYFLHNADLGLTKIGYSTNGVTQRVEEIRRMSPAKLDLLGTIDDGSLLLERRLHSYFQTQRQHGEWFADSPELLALARGERGDLISALRIDLPDNGTQRPRAPKVRLAGQGAGSSRNSESWQSAEALQIAEQLGALGESRIYHRTEAIADTQRIRELVPRALEAGLTKTDVCRLARISWPTLETMLQEDA